MLNSLIIFICRFITWFIRTAKLGAGSTWPGHIALFLNPHIAHALLSQNKIKTVLVVGTNGKTTTSKLLNEILEKNGHTVIKNKEGANLLNGIVTSLIHNSSLAGTIHGDVAIFEVDENMLPIVTAEITPYAIIFLNLFRDQLDRYGEVNSISAKWQTVLKNLPASAQIYINGDDPQLFYIGSKLKQKVHYFGLSKKHFTVHIIPHDVDSVYCPQCGKKLIYKGISYSHLGDFSCSSCEFKRENVTDFENYDFPKTLLGKYNVYNLSAGAFVASEAFNLSQVNIESSLRDFSPAYGRQEMITYKGNNIFMLLSKNPVGFNQSIEVIMQKYEKGNNNIVLILNDRIPDGTDVSWIWDAEFDKLHGFASKIFVTGDRVYDMALRLKYGLYTDPKIDNFLNTVSFESVSCYESVKEAIDEAASSSIGKNDCIILATYSGMLEARKVVLGRKIL